MDKGNFKIDLIKCTKEECIQFAEKIVKDKIEEDELKNIFDYYIIKDDYKEEDAVNLIKNVILIVQNVNLSKTEFNTYSGRLLLSAAKYIKIEGSLNLKILYALCLSQFNENQTDFKNEAIYEIIYEINRRIKCLVKREKDNAYFIQNIQRTFKELVDKNRKKYSFYF